MKSLESICIRIQTLIKALYTRFQPIYLYIALNRLNAIAISQIQSLIKNKGITYPLTRSGSISLNL
jgi:hypothetical protein